MKIITVFLISPDLITGLTCSFHILKNVSMLKIPITKGKTLNVEYSLICPSGLMLAVEELYQWICDFTFPWYKIQNYSDGQILWSLYSVDFHSLTLQLPIQTLHSVAPELQVFVSSLENCQNFSKTSTSQLIGNIIIKKQSEHYTKSDGHPKSMNNLTLNKPVIKDIVNACECKKVKCIWLQWLVFECPFHLSVSPILNLNS